MQHLKCLALNATFFVVLSNYSALISVEIDRCHELAALMPYSVSMHQFRTAG